MDRHYLVIKPSTSRYVFLPIAIGRKTLEVTVFLSISLPIFKAHQLGKRVLVEE